MRLAALALAGRAGKADNNPRATSALRELAAAVTLLQGRPKGTEPLESLLLAQV